MGVRLTEFRDALSGFASRVNRGVPLVNAIQMRKPLTPSSLRVVGQNHAAASYSSNRSACNTHHSIATRIHQHESHANLRADPSSHKRLGNYWFHNTLHSTSWNDPILCCNLPSVSAINCQIDRMTPTSLARLADRSKKAFATRTH